MKYQEWVERHPQAAAELQVEVLDLQQVHYGVDGKSEGWAQQHVRFTAARLGWYTARNNVGATPAKCKECGVVTRPVRYGLSNESHQMNKIIKSSDIIGIEPVLITPTHVGQTIGRFVAIESKRPGWQFSGNEHEQAQAAFGALVVSKGGRFQFSTGELSE